MARAKKVELSPEVLLEILRPFLEEELPKDAKLANAYFSPGNNVAGVLIYSEEYPEVGNGDQVFYAPRISIHELSEFTLGEEKPNLAGQAPK